jgi:hypothetical protein
MIATWVEYLESNHFVYFCFETPGVALKSAWDPLYYFLVPACHRAHKSQVATRISQIGKSKYHFCHRTLQRNGIVSYWKDAISP